MLLRRPEGVQYAGAPLGAELGGGGCLLSELEGDVCPGPGQHQFAGQTQCFDPQGDVEGRLFDRHASDWADVAVLPGIVGDALVVFLLHLLGPLPYGIRVSTASQQNIHQLQTLLVGLLCRHFACDVQGRLHSVSVEAPLIVALLHLLSVHVSPSFQKNLHTLWASSTHSGVYHAPMHAAVCPHGGDGAAAGLIGVAAVLQKQPQELRIPLHRPVHCHLKGRGCSAAATPIVMSLGGIHLGSRFKQQSDNWKAVLSQRFVDRGSSVVRPPPPLVPLLICRVSPPLQQASNLRGLQIIDSPQKRLIQRSLIHLRRSLLRCSIRSSSLLVPLSGILGASGSMLHHVLGHNVRCFCHNGSLCKRLRSDGLDWSAGRWVGR
mmetsp:Transcript_67404/g.112865  ORF Transcript_67404/g.112865 Transcript_67404/m.112865 type:complete len:377 (+) Transcript_67404:1468-2598(+)